MADSKTPIDAPANLIGKELVKPNKMELETHLLTESWLSDKSFMLPSESNVSLDEKSSEELQKLKEELTLELLWIGQAVASRKAYLKLKSNGT